jgi:hypothetical protein
MPSEELITKMMKFNEELVKARVIFPMRRRSTGSSR